MLFTLLAFAVALGTLIVFHELGHYWVARLCGVKILRFSVGFGKVVASRYDRHGTEWALSAWPLGGYVKMQDDPPPGASAEEAAAAFSRKPVGQRIAIVAAGPIFNLILAVFLYAGLNMAGTEEPVAVIAQPAAETPAARAGLLPGDRILAIDGEQIASWSDARWRLMDVMATGGTTQIEVRNASGSVHLRELALPSNSMDPSGGDPLAAAGIRLAQPRPAVRAVIDGGEGQAAGLRPGDLVVAVDGAPTPDTGALVRQIQESAGKTLALTLARDGANVSAGMWGAADHRGADDAQLGDLGGGVPRVEALPDRAGQRPVGVQRDVGPPTGLRAASSQRSTKSRARSGRLRVASAHTAAVPSATAINRLSTRWFAAAGRLRTATIAPAATARPATAAEPGTNRAGRPASSAGSMARGWLSV